MLSTAYDHRVDMNPKARPVIHGQDINPQTYATCANRHVLQHRHLSTYMDLGWQAARGRFR